MNGALDRSGYIGWPGSGQRSFSSLLPSSSHSRALKSSLGYNAVGQAIFVPAAGVDISAPAVVSVHKCLLWGQQNLDIRDIREMW